jgi:hypothetical protein
MRYLGLAAAAALMLLLGACAGMYDSPDGGHAFTDTTYGAKDSLTAIGPVS